jgi:hypothetical protein
MKKHPAFLLSLFISVFSFAQQPTFTGALRTDAATYEKMGQAPMPIGSEIPPAVDLSNKMPPPGNQSAQNSCVAWAAAYANYSYINQLNSGCNFTQSGDLNFDCLFSPSFIYNQINKGKNQGSYFLDAFRVMQQEGLAPLSTMPYDPDNWWRQPSVAAREKAKDNRAADIFTETKAYLAKGYAVIASVKVDDYLKKKSDFPQPYTWDHFSATDTLMGHAILLVGYNDTTQTFRFINSFGTEWGSGGYGYISYRIFDQVINEAFIINRNTTAPSSEILLKESKYLDAADSVGGLNFTVDRVQHFQFPPGYRPSPEELFSKMMVFHGRVSIPKGLGKKLQVLIYFYHNQNGVKGAMVGSLNPQTRTLQGQAATGTPELQMPPDAGFSSTYFAQIRYIDLIIPKGYPYTIYQTDLIAEPVLLVDGFPVKIGSPHMFFVRI